MKLVQLSGLGDKNASLRVYIANRPDFADIKTLDRVIIRNSKSHFFSFPQSPNCRDVITSNHNGWSLLATHDFLESLWTIFHRRFRSSPQTRRSACYSLVICVSDMHAFLGNDERNPAPLILGHEAAGVVLQGIIEGKRVTFNPLATCEKCKASLRGQDNICPSR